MAKEKATPQEVPVAPETDQAPAPQRTFKVVGLEKSAFMPVVVGGRQIDLANTAPHEVDLLFKHRDQLPWVVWNE